MKLFVARQPIFDRDRNVVAYELLYRSGTTNAFGSADQNMASVSTVESTLNAFGLESLVGKHLGFFNATRQLLLQEHWRVLPVEHTVIEVLENVEPDEAILQTCVALKAAGYQLALDDFVFSPQYEGLLKLADYVKVDLLLTSPEERRSLAQRFIPRGITMLAEKVETYEDFHEAMDSGYQLFQGYFFSKPEMITTREVSANQISMTRLIAEANRPDLNFAALEDLIKREVAFSLKLLRYLRSAGLGWRHEVETIEQALRVLGEKATRKWTSLVAMTIIGDQKPAELISNTLLRAQFCEEVGALLPAANKRGDYFLVGLLSTLDALLDKPMSVILEQMALGDDVRAALLGQSTPLADCLELVVAYDRGDWARVDILSAENGLDAGALPLAYAKSVEWVGAFNNAT